MTNIVLPLFSSPIFFVCLCSCVQSFYISCTSSSFLLVCWTMGLPQGCGNSNHTPSEVPCERGAHAWIYGVALFYAPLWACIIFTTYAMIMIYKKVRETEKRNLRYAGARNQSRRRTFLRSDKVATQANLYTVAFYITWAPSTIWSITHWFDKPMFWLDMLSCICEPSQGCMNLWVFLRPRPEIRARVFSQFCCCFQQTSGGPCSSVDMADDSNRTRRTAPNMDSDVGQSHQETYCESVSFSRNPRKTDTSENEFFEQQCIDMIDNAVESGPSEKHVEFIPSP